MSQKELVAFIPPRLRLVVLTVSVFGSFGRPALAFLAELSRRTGGAVPPPLLPAATWAAPRLRPSRGWRSPRRSAGGLLPLCGQGGRERPRTLPRRRTRRRRSTVRSRPVRGPAWWGVLVCSLLSAQASRARVRTQAPGRRFQSALRNAGSALDDRPARQPQTTRTAGRWMLLGSKTGCRLWHLARQHHAHRRRPKGKAAAEKFCSSTDRYNPHRTRRTRPGLQSR